MPKTIEERMKALLYERDLMHGWRERDDPKGDYLDTCTWGQAATIIAGWNAAVEAMKLLLLDYDENPPSEADNHPGWWGCRYCDGEQWDHPDRHTPDKCPVAAAQAALALMEGDLPADETVV